jgi:hypothetical protein
MGKTVNGLNVKWVKERPQIAQPLGRGLSRRRIPGALTPKLCSFFSFELNMLLRM